MGFWSTGCSHSLHFQVPLEAFTHAISIRKVRICLIAYSLLSQPRCLAGNLIACSPGFSCTRLHFSISSRSHKARQILVLDPLYRKHEPSVYLQMHHACAAICKGIIYHARKKSACASPFIMALSLLLFGPVDTPLLPHVCV